jgi:hypothetical protein
MGGFTIAGRTSKHVKEIIRGRDTMNDLYSILLFRAKRVGIAGASGRK